ncbi:MAG: adenylate/guanylate cyclase domain-containing protein, partial [Deltaproteobacteria bacterium]|nr:adenylate/guanylate cyclase domain-containing protein [Deltaproteobacteria bacterium]
KFIGDAVMAVFGGVLELDNPSTSALLAAQEMQRRLSALNERWQHQGLPQLQAGIGLHLGKVLQGAIGSRHRKDFTVIGDAVNLASRVEGMTKDRGEPILLTVEVQKRLPPDLRARCMPLGAFKIRGRQGEIALFGLREADPTLDANVPATRDVN